MGILDQLAGALGGSADTKQAELLNVALNLMQKNGGLEGMLQQFQQGGLAEQVASWVGSGSNASLDMDQLRSALNQDQVAQAAQANGLSMDDALSGLTQVLPQLVDRLTPDGNVKSGDDLLSQGLSALGKLF
ncbi:MAG: YidB family protein [Wenzhouxiangellaceae bacterium]